MKRNPSAAFTMVEMMVVMAIIVVLFSMIAGVSSYATRRGYRARAEGEIQMLMSACENYRVDNGTYPRDIPTTGIGVTDTLQPTAHFLPRVPPPWGDATTYQDASYFLYKELTGERTLEGTGSPPTGYAAGAPTGVVLTGGLGVYYNTPDANSKRYVKDMDPRILKVKRSTVAGSLNAITTVYYFQDPFGVPYGYSTAAVKAEQDFELAFKQGTNPTRPTASTLPGFNIGSFDLWSTGGSKTLVAPSGSGAALATAQDLEWSKWIKNW